MLEDLTGILGESPHVGIQVIAYMGFTQLGQFQRRAVVEGVAAGIEQQLLFGQLRHGFGGIHHGQHLGLTRCQHALKTTQYGKGQDDAAILGLFEITAKQIGNRPDQASQGRDIGGHWDSQSTGNCRGIFRTKRKCGQFTTGDMVFS